MFGSVYCIKDPKTLEVRYVGFTRVGLNVRFSQHKHSALKRKTLSHFYNWFRSSVNENKMPVIHLLEDKISIDRWEEREDYWISQFKNLTNQKSGGTGIHLNTKGLGRKRSVDAKKISVVQLSSSGRFIKEWKCIKDAELSFSNKVTGNIYRAMKSKSIGFGYLWIKKELYSKDKKYSFKAKQYRDVYLFCLYTRKLIFKYEKSSDLAKQFFVKNSLITQALKKNLVFQDLFFVRSSNEIVNPPEQRPVYLFNGNYYNVFNQMYKNENMPMGLGYQKKIKNQYLVKNVSQEIINKMYSLKN